MPLWFPRAGRVVASLFLLASLVGASGCALLGPRLVRTGREAYNQAIVASNSQQMLAMLVRMRYGEPSGLLAVSNITANMRVQANVGGEFGMGTQRNYQGNLVPLSAGLGYEENPTISYTPLQGERYMRQLLSPLPIDLATLVLQAVHGAPSVQILLLRSVNGILNPDYLPDAPAEPDPRFAGFVAALAALSRNDHVTWAHQPRDAAAPYALLLSGRGDDYAARLASLFAVLGFDPPSDVDRVVSLPVRLGVGQPAEPALILETRSLFDAFSLAAASVEVPAEHQESGLAEPTPAMGPASASIRIHGSEQRPEHALTAVEHHGWWFWIDATDAESKLTFRILASLLSVRIADTVDHSKSTPVLTVPVSQ